jgi:hypothetical protein
MWEIKVLPTDNGYYIEREDVDCDGFKTAERLVFQYDDQEHSDKEAFVRLCYALMDMVSLDNSKHGSKRFYAEVR